MKVRGCEGELSKGVRFLQAVGLGRVSIYMNELEIMAGIYGSIFDIQVVKHVNKCMVCSCGQAMKGIYCLTKIKFLDM